MPSCKSLPAWPEAGEIASACLTANMFSAKRQPQADGKRRIVVGFAPERQVLPVAHRTTGEAPGSVSPHAGFPSRFASLAAQRGPAEQSAKEFSQPAPACDTSITVAAVRTCQLHGRVVSILPRDLTWRRAPSAGTPRILLRGPQTPSATHRRQCARREFACLECARRGAVRVWSM
jgi:hypothetical protein